MKILVYGAGTIGCLYAARLKDAGQDVAVLARGRRLQDIREHGIRLEEFGSGQKTTTKVQTVEQLAPNDGYDLVLVVLPRHSIEQVLPILAANENTPSVMFVGNNGAGADAMVEALGRDRVLLGFPGAAAIVHDDTIRYVILSAREQPTTIGEVDSIKSERIVEIADAVQAAGFPMSICTNMDAWLKTHVMEISPTANALYMAGGDIERLKRTRDAQLLMLRAIREGHRVLSALGIPITPPEHKKFLWIPEPLLLMLTKRKLDDDAMKIKIGHASRARKEMKAIADEFYELVRRSGVKTPSIDKLRGYLEKTQKPIADGSSEIPVNWRPVWAGFFGIAVLAALAWQLFR